ncbi:hypothetical protein [Erwinia sp. E_sp_B01_9]|uniref:hypothetical protein n=1 Tax=Erwinia sp. E_sp_B01_9 TaxID=3039403 RepID=UPI003D9B13EB
MAHSAYWHCLPVYTGDFGSLRIVFKGFLSDGIATSSDGTLRVEYERFGLRDSDVAMTIRVKPQQGRFTLKLNGEEMENFQIQSLQPQPLQAISHNNTLELTYQSESFHDGATVWIGSQAMEFGRYPVTVSLDDTTSVHFTQWIYP